jgi:hypothetical protein
LNEKETAMNRRRKSACWIILLTVLLATASFHYPYEPAKADGAQAGGEQRSLTHAEEPADSWIVKWRGEPDPTFAESSVVLRAYDASRVYVARPSDGREPAEWLDRWKRSPQIEYIVPNREVRIAAATNDPFIDRQTYLQQTHAVDAWSEVNRSDSIVVALVDTGVDLDHPDLKDNLVTGVNLIQPGQPPRDDNGHGTNVAGVIAAVGNNGKGVAGMLWKTSIMPIKALEPSGRGDEDKLGEGIRYAVDHGADIVVLSVGLLRNDSFLQEIVQYAEDHGVLLIAASGNDEGRNIRYPAAYPTVLAVGGIKENNAIAERANYGPELDLVAPWSVFTTAVGGRYEYRDGTSMAAPQVAAAAAMIWTKYPDLKVHEVRNLLRQTADDVGDAGWDERTGYGLLRVDRALTEPYRTDMYEPNDDRQNAKPFSISRMISAELTGGADADWFAIDVPYDGTLHVQLLSDQPAPSEVKLTHTGYDGVTTKAVSPGETLDFGVRKGRNWIALQFASGAETAAWTYRLSSSFSIYSDPFEENDRQYMAYKLAPRNQTVTGTFHAEDDKDWYAVTFEQSGKVKVKVTPDTKRIDPILTVEKQGERAMTIDDNEDGEPESYAFEVFPGTYYFQVSKLMPDPANGEYAFELQYEPLYIDPNEPNDRSFQATVIGMDAVYEGVFDRASDVDYFKFNLSARSLVRLSVAGIPADREVTLALQSGGLVPIAQSANSPGASAVSMDIPLDPGTYYVRLSASDTIQDRMYELKVHADPLIAGFVDIAGHWAQGAIADLANRGIVSGYGAYTFGPDRKISRAEAVTLIVKAFGYTKRRNPGFTDLPPNHWAYDSVSKAVQAGVVQGYPDGRFDPDGQLSRVEMASLFAEALGIAGKLRGNVPFADLPADHWAVPILKQLKAEGWIEGYADGTFRPDEPTTRAEFVALLSRILHR